MPVRLQTRRFTHKASAILAFFLSLISVFRSTQSGVQSMSDIVRLHTNQRMSRVVKAAGLAFIGGQTALDPIADVKAQTAQVLEKIDGFLRDAGIDKSRLVSAQVWLANIARDFAGMNEVWDAWVPQGCAPTRATVEAKLASPQLLVEISVVALASPLMNTPG
jgi:enamine deaminase RidA (YjgF/YER057c/UK114 family)